MRPSPSRSTSDERPDWLALVKLLLLLFGQSRDQSAFRGGV
jgi:hypothetical protein